ncbi:MAG: hypothetical protein ACKO3N_16290, partial [Verrucomicrobiota bacterium]
PVAAGDLAGPGAALVFEARAGRDYALAVDGANGFTTGFTLDLELAVAEPPRLTAAMGVDGRLQLAGAPLPPGRWVLESSPDLRDWSEAGQVPAGTPPAVSLPAEVAARFYRLRRVD